MNLIKKTISNAKTSAGTNSPTTTNENVVLHNNVSASEYVELENELNNYIKTVNETYSKRTAQKKIAPAEMLLTALKAGQLEDERAKQALEQVLLNAKEMEHKNKKLSAPKKGLKFLSGIVSGLTIALDCLATMATFFVMMLIWVFTLGFGAVLFPMLTEWNFLTKQWLNYTSKLLYKDNNYSAENYASIYEAYSKTGKQENAKVNTTTPEDAREHNHSLAPSVETSENTCQPEYNVEI